MAGEQVRLTVEPVAGDYHNPFLGAVPTGLTEDKWIQAIEIHPGETVEEKISLSERFGLWVSFYPFDQDEYLTIVDYWLGQLGVPERERGTAARNEALQWALTRGSRSGRVAWHFARDWAGRHKIASKSSRK